MAIELRHLRYFVAVAEELHFGRAAARLNISQPPLSQQIQQLEQETGARLLARTNRSVSLTPAGTQFLADSRQILSQVDAAATRAARLHQGETGELRIGFTSSAPFISAVSDSLSTFRQRYPDVHIQTLEINTRAQIGPLSEGALDLGLMRNTRLPDSLAWQLILREPLLAMIHRDHPLAALPTVSLHQLASEPFVFFDPHVGTGLYDDILGLLHRYGISPYITQEVGEAMTIIGLVAAGLGVSILPASFKRVQLAEMRWVPITEPDAISEMWLVWPKHRERSAATQRFMSLLTGAALSLNPAAAGGEKRAANHKPG
ncbi:LysR family transcriptional regulator [Siccibacter colletis]|uniref:LysR family transcriptional regulator n=1 Tax=Siccibacter colletis TaxID=1505757 RepID=UPI00068B7346|nr:LysR family transcriptional regulator [Siccibacter colletis]